MKKNTHIIKLSSGHILITGFRQPQSNCRELVTKTWLSDVHKAMTTHGKKQSIWTSKLASKISFIIANSGLPKYGH